MAYKIFVSGVQNELKEERASVKQFIERNGLLREHFVDVNNGGKHVGKRVLVCFSPQGNAYVREKIIKPRMDGANV